MYTIKHFFGLDGLRQAKDDWEFIYRHLFNRDFQFNYDWYRCYLEYLAPKDEKFHAFIIYQGGLPKAVFPLREGIIRKVRVTLRVLESPPQLPFSDCVMEDDESADEIIDYFLHYLSSESPIKCDALLFYRLMGRSPILNYSTTGKKRTVIKEAHKLYSYVDTATSYEDLKKTFSSNRNKNLKYYRAKLKKSGEVEIVSSTEKEDILKDFETFMEVEASGWKGEEGTAIKSNDAMANFLRSVVASFCEKNECRIYLLRLNSVCISSWLCFLGSDTLYTLKIGYREDFSKFSPGIVLLDQVIQDAAKEDRIKHVNFMSYKDYFHGLNPSVLPSYRVYLFPRSVPSLVKMVIIKINSRLKFLYSNRIKKSSGSDTSESSGNEDSLQ